MKPKKAFTLIELLVVIAIIGILATISVLALSNARAKSRDAKRAGDVKQIQTALELFFNDKNRYPTIEEWNTGKIYSTSTGVTSTYMQVIPLAPTPSDGNCSSLSNQYNYAVSADGSVYEISYCLCNATGALSAGSKCVTPGGVSGAEFCGFSSCGDSGLYRGDIYSTVQIGSQCWFKENLMTTEYNDNTNIPNLTDNAEWQNDSTGAYSWYNNDYATYGATYGALYNFYAVDTGKLCPTGWHVPTDAEFKTLVEGQGTPGCESSTGWQCSPAGSKLKEAGTVHWNSPNTGADNSSGFTALGSGARYGDGSFNDQGVIALWWSSSLDGVQVWDRYLDTGSQSVYRHSSGKRGGFSVRCLKD